CRSRSATRSRVPSTSKEPPGGADALPEVLEPFRVVAHRSASVSGRYRRPVPAVRPLDHERDAETCDAIIAGLPGWFGLEEGMGECARAVRTHAGLVADVHGEVKGFLTYVRHSAAAAEITWMGVHAAERGRGIGTALMQELVTGLSASGARLLFVQTLSD